MALSAERCGTRQSLWSPSSPSAAADMRFGIIWPSHVPHHLTARVTGVSLPCIMAIPTLASWSAPNRYFYVLKPNIALSFCLQLQ